MRMLNISRIDDLIANSMDILEPPPVDADGNAREDGTCLSFIVGFILFIYRQTLIILLKYLAVKDVVNLQK